MAKNEKKSVEESALNCPKCGGTGSNNWGPICQLCDGSGRFTAPVVVVEEVPEAAEPEPAALNGTEDPPVA